MQQTLITNKSSCKYKLPDIHLYNFPVSRVTEIFLFYLKRISCQRSLAFLRCGPLKIKFLCKKLPLVLLYGSDEDSGKKFLVDFEQKSLNVLAEKRREEKTRAEAEEKKRREDEEERRLLAEEIPEADDPADQWFVCHIETSSTNVFIYLFYKYSVS